MYLRIQDRSYDETIFDTCYPTLCMTGILLLLTFELVVFEKRLCESYGTLVRVCVCGWMGGCLCMHMSVGSFLPPHVCISQNTNRVTTMPKNYYNWFFLKRLF